MLGIDVRAMLGLPELSLHTLAYLPKPSRNEGGAAAYVGKTSHPWIAELQTCLSASLILTTNAGTCHCNVNEAFTQTFMNKEAVDALTKERGPHAVPERIIHPGDFGDFFECVGQLYFVGPSLRGEATIAVRCIDRNGHVFVSLVQLRSLFAEGDYAALGVRFLQLPQSSPYIRAVPSSQNTKPADCLPSVSTAASGADGQGIHHQFQQRLSFREGGVTHTTTVPPNVEPVSPCAAASASGAVSAQVKTMPASQSQQSQSERMYALQQQQLQQQQHLQAQHLHEQHILQAQQLEQQGYQPRQPVPPLQQRSFQPHPIQTSTPVDNVNKR